jgi:hypothetical protein
MLPLPAPALRSALTWPGHVVHERRPAARGYPGPLDARLSGTGLVADDLYLLAHDDRPGKPLLRPVRWAPGCPARSSLRCWLAASDCGLTPRR